MVESSAFRVVKTRSEPEEHHPTETELGIEAETELVITTQDGKVGKILADSGLVLLIL